MASAETKATPPRLTSTERSQNRLSPFFKRTPAEGKKSDDAKKGDSPNNESQSTGDTPLVEPPERTKGLLLGESTAELEEIFEEIAVINDTNK
jgi:hypothetical protein